jgi:hypothetical protein
MSGGLVVVVSSRPFEDTLNALIASVKHRQVEVFGMVDLGVAQFWAGVDNGQGATDRGSLSSAEEPAGDN